MDINEQDTLLMTSENENTQLTDASETEAPAPKKKEKKRQTKYMEYLEERRERIKEIHEKQKEILLNNYLDTKTCENIIMNILSRSSDVLLILTPSNLTPFLPSLFITISVLCSSSSKKAMVFILQNSSPNLISSLSFVVLKDLAIAFK